MMDRPRQDLVIRPADAGDLNAVAAIWFSSAQAMDGVQQAVPSQADLRRRIDHELQSGWELCIALDGEIIVGMLALKPEAAVLDQIFVAPANQGAGVGKALLLAAQRRMARGFTLRMDAANERARQFYESNGLTKSGDGLHPATGISVHYYEWKPAEPVRHG